MCTELEDAKIRLGMDSKLLFFTSVMYQLEVRLGETSQGTAETNGKEIVFDPEFIKTLPADELLGVLLHEVRHVSDMHSLRIGDRCHEVWNAACDHVINLDILASGYKLPSWVLQDKRFTNMGVEEVYDILIKEGKPQKNPMPDLIIPEGQSEEDLKELSEDIKDIVIQAVQLAERHEAAAGNIPNHVKLQVEEWLNPVVPWDSALRRYMVAFDKTDYNWKRPNRRGRAHDLYLPSPHSEHMGDINIYLDLSCSVSDEMVNMQVGQFKYIHRSLRPKKLRIVTFNTEITGEFEFKPTDRIDVDFVGRGGTHIGEVVEHIKANPAECHLIFTDGYFDQSPLETLKRQELLWCIYNNGAFIPALGSVIHIKE